jgi:F-type H+-transporting ATPase subunit epsilon
MGLHVQITTPEKLVFEKEADYAEIPGKDGYMGILPGHAALLSELGAGELKLTVGGIIESFQITGGYVEIRDDKVRVLADSVS